MTRTRRWEPWLSRFSEIQRALRDFVFPVSCEFCGASLKEGETSNCSLCERCQQELSPAIDNPCRRCGASAGPYLDVSQNCISCQGDRFHFDQLWRLNIYRNSLRDAVLRCQQPAGIPLTAALTGLLYRQEQTSIRQHAWDWILPVPQHWMQRLKRPYHPPIIMAEVLSRCLKIPYSLQILTKPRPTPAQSHLSPAERRKNLRGAFRVNRSTLGLVRNSSILLVDDVLTTGTTASRVARTLKDSGAALVGVAVLARGIGEQ